MYQDNIYPEDVGDLVRSVLENYKIKDILDVEAFAMRMMLEIYEKYPDAQKKIVSLKEYNKRYFDMMSRLVKAKNDNEASVVLKEIRDEVNRIDSIIAKRNAVQ